jgi:PKD repeat protein
MRQTLFVKSALVIVLLVLTASSLTNLARTSQRVSATPPNASFVYYPTKLYENMTATFDASMSSAEGENDTIIRYEWTFNDPYNPEHIIKEGNYTNPPSPLATHNFPHSGTFIIDLNVTDTEGLSSTAFKPVTIIAESGPTANFTYTPTQIYANVTQVTFNASLSTAGWSKQIAAISPIVQYIWNFSDGTGNITTSNPIINHTFVQNGTRIVKLTVVDSVARTNTTTASIQVLYSVFKWDVTGDGYVGIDDIFAVASHFGQTPGSPGWDPKYDMNGDNYIGVDDIFEVATHFGEQAP